MDYGTPKADALAELTCPRKTGTGFAHHDLVGLVEFDPTPLVTNADPAFIHPGEGNQKTQEPFGIWAVYECNLPDSHERFSLLFLGVEAIQALAALFPTRAPHGLVVQEDGEALDLEVRQQALDLAVGQFAAFNAGGGADAFNRCDPPQSREAIRCESSQCSPRALEFIYLSDQPQDLWGDLDGVGSDHGTNPTPNNTH